MNIYIRTQNNDLLKYLSDQQSERLLAKCEKLLLKAGECVFLDKQIPDYFIMLLQGELELKQTQGSSIGSIFPGEVEAEAGFIEPAPSPYYLQAVKACTLLKLPYAVMRTFIAEKPEHGARIHAAINDSLCLKIIRLTHRRNHG